jgi:dynactin complex subunit
MEHKEVNSNRLTALGMILTVVISISGVWVTNLVTVGQQGTQITNLESSVEKNREDNKASERRISNLEAKNAMYGKDSERLNRTLEKLDKTMNLILVKDAVQDEKIQSNTKKLDRERGG